MDSSEEALKNFVLPEGSLDLTDYPKAWIRTGQFIWMFALVEQSLNNLVAKLFGIDPIFGKIITANMDFRRKINVAQSGLSFQGNPLSLDAAKLKILFGDLNRLHDDRNVDAHSFFSFKDDKVRFFSDVARKTLNISYLDWDRQKFAKSVGDMHSIAGTLTVLTSEAHKIHNPAEVIDAFEALQNVSERLP